MTRGLGGVQTELIWVSVSEPYTSGTALHVQCVYLLNTY